MLNERKKNTRPPDLTDKESLLLKLVSEKGWVGAAKVVENACGRAILPSELIRWARRRVGFLRLCHNAATAWEENQPVPESDVDKGLRTLLQLESVG